MASTSHQRRPPEGSSATCSPPTNRKVGHSIAEHGQEGDVEREYAEGQDHEPIAGRGRRPPLATAKVGHEQGEAQQRSDGQQDARVERRADGNERGLGQLARRPEQQQ